MKTSIRTPEEIKAIEKACEIADQAFSYTLTKTEINVTEKKLSKEIKSFIKKHKAPVAFKPIVAFGENASEPHHKATNRKLVKGDFIKIDLGIKLNGFCSDLTRTVFMGKVSNKQKRIYNTVLKAQELAIKFVNHKSSIVNNNGLRAKEVDKVVRNYMISKGYPNMPHGLGHGVGKKIHQSPRLSPKSKNKLKVGQVFTIEPGIYIKDFGGVRIEDTFLLTNKGLKPLTHSTKRIIEL